MAGRFAFLLLCTGIVTLADGYTKTQKPRAAPGPQCSYMVSTIKFGFQIVINSSIPGNFTISATETARPLMRKKIVVEHSDRTSSHELKFLKPCTEYTHAVVFQDGTVNKTSCDPPQNKMTELTSEMKEEDVKDGRCRSGYVCYRSGWNIGSSISASNNVSAEQCLNDSNEFCIKPGSDDICTNLTTTFKSENCDSSFNRTKYISVDFLNGSDMNQKITTGLPAKINEIRAPNCKNLSVEYTCHENGLLDEPKTLKELEPFTDYECLRRITDNSVNQTNTSVIHLSVDCDDLQTKIPGHESESRSVEMSLTTTSQRCNVSFTDYKKFSVICRCNDNKQVRVKGDMCRVDGLDPFTGYVCRAQARWGASEVGEALVNVKTKSEKPDDVYSVSVSNPEHNAIRVTCNHSRKFHGPGGKYTATLLQSGEVVAEKENKTSECKFEFKDLRYLTTYNIKVAAVNRDFKGREETEKADTLYNDKAVIGQFA